MLFLTLIVKEHSVSDVSRFIRSIISKLRSIASSRAKCRAGLLALVSIAATQSPLMVIDELLQNESAFAELNRTNSVSGEIWRKLGGQNVTGEQVWDILREKITNTETFSLSNAMYGGSRRSSKVNIQSLEIDRHLNDSTYRLHSAYKLYSTLSYRLYL